jgi:flavin reductase (DIM6/NTAB) family NADH-FMN oxidoreductase RutF
VFFPAPVVLITCQGASGRPNILPVAGVGVVNRFPFMVGIAICKRDLSQGYFKRYSHGLIRKSGEFAVNIPHAGLQKAIDVCGSVSGKKQDKFALTGLAVEKSRKIRAPVLAACPINLECIVRKIVALPSHDWIIGEVVMIHVDNDVLRGKKQITWNYVPKLKAKRAQ